MSGRIRTFKPEILEDEATGNLSGDAYKLYTGLILRADDYGNLRDGERLLEGQIFCHRLPEKPFANLKAEVIDAGLVEAYVVRGQRYLHLKGWEKHQRVDKPGAPRVPRPDEADGSVPGAFANDSRKPREGLANAPRTTPEVPANVPRTPPETLAPDLDLDQDLDHDPSGAGACTHAQAQTPARGPDRPTFTDLRLTYGKGIEDAIGNAYIHRDQPEEGRALEQLWEFHAKGMSPQDFLRWLRKTVAEYANATRAKAHFQKGYAPSKCVEWLNAGRPKVDDHGRPQTGDAPAAAPRIPFLRPDKTQGYVPPHVLAKLAQEAAKGLGSGVPPERPKPRDPAEVAKREAAG